MKLEIGDIVRVENWLCTYTYKIERVTKTKAIGKAIGDTFTSNFKREYNDENNIRPWSYMAFDTTKRVLIKKTNNHEN